MGFANTLSVADLVRDSVTRARARTRTTDTEGGHDGLRPDSEYVVTE